jgi:hypothetical protein
MAAVPSTLDDMKALREALMASVTRESGAATSDPARLVETSRTLDAVVTAESKLAADLAEARLQAREALARAAEATRTPLPGSVLPGSVKPPLTLASKKELDGVLAKEKAARESASLLLSKGVSSMTRAEATAAVSAARDSARCAETARMITASAALMERVRQLDKVCFVHASGLCAMHSSCAPVLYFMSLRAAPSESRRASQNFYSEERALLRCADRLSVSCGRYGQHGHAHHRGKRPDQQDRG